MATLPIDYTFTNGQVANANHVNTNFQSIKTFVEASLVSTDGAVQAGTAAIADNAVTTAKIANLNVTTGKIANDAVTAEKIATGAVGNTEIAATAVTADKLAWALPRGVVARTTSTSDTGFTAAQLSIFPTVSFSAVANRMYMVEASCYVDIEDAVDGVFFANLINSSDTVQNLASIQTISYFGDLVRTRIATNYLYIPGSTITQSFNINIGRFGGSGNIRNLASAGNPSHLTVIDVGGVV